MSTGILLDPRTGRPQNRKRMSVDDILHQLDSNDRKIGVPDHVQAWLDKGADQEWASLPKASSVGWRDVLNKRRVIQTDGTAVSATTTETIITPDYTFAADEVEPGDTYNYQLWGNVSTVITTPGTITMRLRWGGVGGTALATSGAYAPDPTAASTTIAAMVEYVVVVRSVGTSGSMFCMGRMFLNDFDDATATTLQGNLNMIMIPTGTPAAVTVDTTTSKALSPTIAFSVATAGTQWTTNIAILESLN